MQISLEKRHPQSPVHMIWGAIAILGIGVAGVLRGIIPYLPPCIFKAATGIPCLTCGGTRSISSLAKLDLAGSFMQNPMIFLGLVGLIGFSVLVLAGWIFKRRLAFSFTPIEKRALRLTVIALIAINWAYLILQARW